MTTSPAPATRRAQLEAFLRDRGYQMDFDPGSIPGEGHYLVRCRDDHTIDIDEEEVPEDVVTAAREWSELTDRLAEADD